MKHFFNAFMCVLSLALMVLSIFAAMLTEWWVFGLAAIFFFISASSFYGKCGWDH